MYVKSITIIYFNLFLLPIAEGGRQVINVFACVYVVVSLLATYLKNL